jgi:hypothetical protein
MARSNMTVVAAVVLEGGREEGRREGTFLGYCIVGLPLIQYIYMYHSSAFCSGVGDDPHTSYYPFTFKQVTANVFKEKSTLIINNSTNNNFCVAVKTLLPIEAGPQVCQFTET